MRVFLRFKLYSGILFSILTSSPIMGQSEYKIFGHRGCRGVYPENTIEGFKKAIEFGVDGIELDVVVNKNQELPHIFSINNELDYSRVYKIADEFEIDFIIKERK